MNIVKIRSVGRDIKSSLQPLRYLRLRSRRSSDRTTSMRRSLVSMFRQKSAASGIRISPREVSTSSSGVPEISLPGNCTSLTVPTRAGVLLGEQGEEETTGDESGVSNTEHPIRSETKYFPAVS